MNDQQLHRNLNSIGKECLVTFFNEFCDLTRSNESVAAQIREERGYTWEACRTRTSKSRRIIKAGRASDALDMVCLSTSPLVTVDTKKRAAELAVGLRESS